MLFLNKSSRSLLCSLKFDGVFFPPASLHYSFKSRNRLFFFNGLDYYKLLTRELLYHHVRDCSREHGTRKDILSHQFHPLTLEVVNLSSLIQGGQNFTHHDAPMVLAVCKDRRKNTSTKSSTPPPQFVPAFHYLVYAYWLQKGFKESTLLDVLISATTCKIWSKGTCSALKTLFAFMSQKKIYFSELKRGVQR